MDHPPIPPNCEWFFQSEGKWFFGWNHEGALCPYPISLEPFDGDVERPIIAAVARCAWEDEACRRFEAHPDGDPEFIDQAEEAKKAWKQWGS